MKRWVAFGLIWSVLMICWANIAEPMIFGTPAKTTRALIISLLLWPVAGLSMSYLMHRYFAKPKQPQV